MTSTMDRSEEPSKHEAGRVVWITGRPQSGKSTFAEALAQRLRRARACVAVLDGDRVRAALVPRPGYDESGREAFYATLAELAAELAKQPLVVVVAATAHARRFRDRARALAPRGFVEIFVEASEAECRARDRKGLYVRFDAGDAPSLPGTSVAYEEPMAPDLRATGGLDDAALERAAKLCGVHMGASAR